MSKKKKKHIQQQKKNSVCSCWWCFCPKETSHQWWWYVHLSTLPLWFQKHRNIIEILNLPCPCPLCFCSSLKSQPSIHIKFSFFHLSPLLYIYFIYIISREREICSKLPFFKFITFFEFSRYLSSVMKLSFWVLFKFDYNLWVICKNKIFFLLHYLIWVYVPWLCVLMKIMSFCCAFGCKWLLIQTGTH